MNDEPASQRLTSYLGMSSVVIGITGLFLFLLPILGIPLSLFGLAFGVLGSAFGIFVHGDSLRWGLGGTAVSALALAVNLSIAYAPDANAPGYNVPKNWQAAPGAAYVSPPASGSSTFGSD
jgi:hypothetical protein